MIEATFNGNEKYTRVSGLTQWDYGRVLRINGLNPEPNETFELQFSTECGVAQRCSTTVQDGYVEATVPDELLEKGENINAYLYREIPDAGMTIYTVCMMVKRRPKPEDYSSPEHKDIINDIKDELAKKADNMEMTSDGLQLTSSGEPIGVPVKISGGGVSEIDSIENSDIDAILNGESPGENEKYLDQNGLDYFVDKNDKRYVKQEQGKGLSQNDFTNEYKKMVDDLVYVKIAYTSASTTHATNEIGATVTDFNVAWALNKTPKTQKIKFGAESEEIIEVDVRNKVYTGKNVKGNMNIVLTATDERNATASRTLSVSFQPKVYWGVAVKKAEYADEDLLGLSGNALANGKTRTFTVNAGDDQYILYAIPSSFGVPTFKVNGFEGGFVKANTFEHTNASGYSQNYDVWKSVNPNLGNTQVVVT